MRKLIDLTGQRFGRLVAIQEAGRTADGAVRWRCQCDCDGNFVTVRNDHLRSGDTQSCGCHRRERLTIHGMHGTPEYEIWKGMLTRCYNTRCKEYPYYGGRGIKACDHLRHSFEVFYADLGPRPPGMSLDRIDNDGNYTCKACSGNCRWATRKEQANNRRPRRWHRKPAA